jgi:predicted unusual protein kinase regulating ubiquinone biosynthesis (AarF/ABC1/UbiB family)
MARRRVSIRERIRRARRIGTTFGRVYLGIKANQQLERRLAPQDMKQRWQRFNLKSAHAIYDAAVELRGLILKGCQFLGSRADVLPPEYVSVLSKLQDRVPPRPYPVIRRVVEHELGCPIGELFSHFSEQPIASASLAQVHEAQRVDGERVAVKVQYPEIAALVRSDLANLKLLFRAVGLIEREFDLMPLVEELATYVPRELDFLNEGRNAETIAEYFAQREDVHVPAIHWDLTTRRVLVMEFMDGIKISDAEALQAAGVDTNEVMRMLIEAYCEQVMSRGFFHADPHPGNLLVQPGRGGDGDRPRLVFLDFGLAKDLPGNFRKSIVSFAAAMLSADPEAMARALVELGFETREGGPEALATIARIVLDVVSQLRHQSFVDRDLTRRAGDDIPRLVRENPIVRIPSHVVLLGRVIGLLSGLGRTLDGKVDMVKTVLPYAMGAGGTSPLR